MNFKSGTGTKEYWQDKSKRLQQREIGINEWNSLSIQEQKNRTQGLINYWNSEEKIVAQSERMKNLSVEKKEKISLAAKEGKKKSLEVTEVFTGIITIFNSLNDASKKLNLRRNTLSKHISLFPNVPYKGYSFKRIEKEILTEKKCKLCDTLIKRDKTYCQECFKKYQKNWRKENQNNLNNKERIRRKQDPVYRLRKILRARLSKIFVKNGKKCSHVKDLGCSIDELKIYLEGQFQPGMTWDNHGEWHVDHRIPLASFDLSNKDELLKAIYYTNLQPLWAKDNLSKGSKILDI